MLLLKYIFIDNILSQHNRFFFFFVLSTGSTCGQTLEGYTGLKFFLEVGLRVNDYLFSFFSLQNSYLCDQKKVNFNCNSVTEIDLTEIIVYMNTSDKYFAVCMSLLKDCSFITYSCYSLWWISGFLFQFLC